MTRNGTPRQGEPRAEPPAMLIEQLVLGELPEASKRALEAEFGAERIASLCAKLEADNQALAERFAREHLPSPETLAHHAERRREKQRRRRWHSADMFLQRLVLAGVALLAVVTAVMVAGPEEDGPGAAPREPGGTPGSQASGGLEGTRIKGLRPHILAFLKRGEVVEPLAGGDDVQAGDLIQLGYVAAGQAHGVLLSIDGRGVATLHFPEQPGLSTRLEQEGEALLESAYSLDDAPEFERFVLVTTDKPLAVADVLAAARELAKKPGAARTEPLPLPQAQQQHSLLLRKVVR